MKGRVKIFKNKSEKRLEKAINAWLDDNLTYEIEEIRYSTVVLPESINLSGGGFFTRYETIYSALLMYQVFQ